MTELPKPPSTHTEFVECYPELGRAWELMAEGGKNGPLDDDTARLVKLGVAIGAMREGSVHASVRKATAQGRGYVMYCSHHPSSAPRASTREHTLIASGVLQANHEESLFTAGLLRVCGSAAWSSARPRD